MFTQKNTQGYTDATLAELNRQWDAIADFERLEPGTAKYYQREKEFADVVSRTMEHNDTLEAELIQALVSLDAAVVCLRSSLGQVHAMHGAARAVAPEWLRRWDDDKRWLICFTQGYRGLVVFAQAFGLSKDELLASMKPYHEEQTDERTYR